MPSDICVCASHPTTRVLCLKEKDGTEFDELCEERQHMRGSCLFCVGKIKLIFLIVTKRDLRSRLTTAVDDRNNFFEAWSAWLMHAEHSYEDSTYVSLLDDLNAPLHLPCAHWKESYDEQLH
jgi:hypothetical protein